MDTGEADRKKVADSRILVCGAGKLGRSVVDGLLDSGFRHIVVADLFCSGIRGSADGYPDAAVTPLKKTVKEIDGWNYDLIVGCLSDTPSRLLVNSKAKEYSIPYVDGTVFGKRGRIQTVLFDGPCLECCMIRSARIRSAKNVPETDPDAVRTTASLILDEALKIASGHADRCIRGIVYCNADNESLSIIPIEVDRNCPNHNKLRKGSSVPDIDKTAEISYDRPGERRRGRTANYTA